MGKRGIPMAPISVNIAPHSDGYRAASVGNVDSALATRWPLGVRMLGDHCIGQWPN